jgi:hypothetical protein
MKYKLIAFVLALTAVSWAQTATQPEPSAPQQPPAATEKSACPCCEKVATAEAKDAHSCCAHHDMAATEGKEPMSCAGKSKDKASCCNHSEAMSCSRSKDTTAACCGSDKCEKDGEKGCCAAGKKGETQAMNSCEKSMGHGTADASK